MLTGAHEHLDEAKKLVSFKDRWTTPGAETLPPKHITDACYTLGCPSENPTSPEWQWACGQSLGIGRYCKEISARYCLALGPGPLVTGTPVQFVCDENYSVRFLTEWRIQEDATPDKQWCRAQLVTPFIHIDSVTWLAGIFRDRFVPAGDEELTVDVRKHRVLKCWQDADGSINARIECEPNLLNTLTRKLPKAAQR
eukprot:9466429-Pyramimonas_sp.AAC.1